MPNGAGSMKFTSGANSARRSRHSGANRERHQRVGGDIHARTSARIGLSRNAANARPHGERSSAASAAPATSVISSTRK